MITVVFIPGLLSDEVVWQPMADALADRYQVAIADSRAGVSLAAMAKAMLAEYPGDLAVVGHSMGGRIALEMLRYAPERIKKLALVDSGVHGLGANEKAKRQVLIDLARAEGMEALLEAWLPPMVHPDRHNDPIMDELREMVLRADVEQFERQIQGLVEREDATDLLPAFDGDLLLAVGRQDEWSNVEQHQAMLDLAPNGELVVIEDAGHFAPMERPQAMLAALETWLAK